MLFLLLLPLFASAQIKIKGRVNANNQQEQVIGANVYFHELKKGAISARRWNVRDLQFAKRLIYYTSKIYWIRANY